MNPIVERIKKLLRMKRGGTPEEVATALALAAELARKHGIDLAGVDPDEERTADKPITHVSEALNSRLPLEAKLAAAILVGFFNVQCVVETPRRWVSRYFPGCGSGKVHLIGTAWDCEVARHVFGFLQSHFRRSWAGRDKRRVRNRDAFLTGMFLGLATKLEQARDAALPQTTGDGLMVINRALQRRRDYLQAHWPQAEDMDIERDRSRAWASKMAGIREGQNTQIRPAVNGKAEEGRLLLA